MRSKVALLKTTPRTVFEDYRRLMHLADYTQTIDMKTDTALKINISWHFFYPAASTTPWQLDAVIRTMLRDGYSPELIHGCHNRTVVIDAHLGERENKHLTVLQEHGLRNIHLYEGQEWIHIRDAVGDLAKDFLALNDVYPKGFMIPKRFIGENIIHLPTVKTHVFTTTTGAMKNAFGGLLNEHRHWTHARIHETLVDLLMIQKKIHSGVFAVMDGTFAGDGPGPRCMRPHVKNVILASSDQVAIDAVAAKLMGFDPMKIPYIRMAHDLGLGCGDIRDLEVLGEPEILERPWKFQNPLEDITFAAKMQHSIYWGPLKTPLEWSLRTWLAPWSYLASVMYHDIYWYLLKARPRILDALNSSWGRLFYNWESLKGDESGFPDIGPAPMQAGRCVLSQLALASRILGTTLKEAPEIKGRR